MSISLRAERAESISLPTDDFQSRFGTAVCPSPSAQGRLEVFEDHHLRVGEVIVDSAPPAGLRSWNNASMRLNQAGRRSSP
jgi:hypothetical protein